MGRLDVDRMLSEISSYDLTEWQCYYGIEPWGEERADWRAGNIASNVLNVNRTDKNQKLWTAKDFMLGIEEQEEQKPKKVSPATQAAYFRLMLDLGAARKRKHGTDA
jgi:hypothetical protein